MGLIQRLGHGEEGDPVSPYAALHHALQKVHLRKSTQGASDSVTSRSTRCNTEVRQLLRRLYTEL